MWNYDYLIKEAIQIVYNNFMSEKNKTKFIQNGDYTWKLDFSQNGVFVRCWYMENKIKLLLHRENDKIRIISIRTTSVPE